MWRHSPTRSRARQMVQSLPRSPASTGAFDATRPRTRLRLSRCPYSSPTRRAASFDFPTGTLTTLDLLCPQRARYHRSKPDHLPQCSRMTEIESAFTGCPAAVLRPCFDNHSLFHDDDKRRNFADGQLWPHFNPNDSQLWCEPSLDNRNQNLQTSMMRRCLARLRLAHRARPLTRATANSMLSEHCAVNPTTRA